MRQKIFTEGTCHHCKKDYKSCKRVIRGYCSTCYGFLKKKGLIETLSSWGAKKCIRCESPIIKGQDIKGWCKSCYAAARPKRHFGEKGYCRQCKDKLDKFSHYSVCTKCRTETMLRWAHLDNQKVEKIKFLTIKWQNEMIRADEIFEAVSMWCDCCYIDQNRNIDSLTPQLQIEYIFLQFQKILNFKLNI